MVTFTITIKNWEKHNGTKKKNHRYFLVENRFFEDAKISQLKQIEVLLFIKCLSIAGDLNASSFVVHAGLMPKRWRVDAKLLENSCKTLQSFQLLTYEKNHSFKIQNNTKQSKTIQSNISSELKIEEKKNEEISTQPNKSVAVAAAAKIQIKISDSKTIEVNKDLVSSWADTYPKDFLNEELKKARNWVLSNPHKAPKAQWGKFLNNWFNRGWDRYRTTLKSNPVKVTMEDLNEVLGGL